MNDRYPIVIDKVLIGLIPGETADSYYGCFCETPDVYLKKLFVSENTNNNLWIGVCTILQEKEHIRKEKGILDEANEDYFTKKIGHS